MLAINESLLLYGVRGAELNRSNVPHSEGRMKARKASANGFICGQAGCMQLSLSILVFFMSLVAVDFLAPPHFTGPALWLSAFLPGSRLRLVQVSCNQLRRVLAPETELSSASPRLAWDFAAQPSSSVQQLSATLGGLVAKRAVRVLCLLGRPPRIHSLASCLACLSFFPSSSSLLAPLLIVYAAFLRQPRRSSLAIFSAPSVPLTSPLSIILADPTKTFFRFTCFAR